MNQLIRFVSILFVLTITTEAAFAVNKKSISIEIGTLGIGLSYAPKSPFYQTNSSSMNMRYGFNYLDVVSFLGESATINYKETDTNSKRKNNTVGEISMLSALVDWHPINNNFRVTFGLVYNNNRAIETASLSDMIVELDSGNKSSLTLKRTTTISFDNVSPYIGIGYGHNLRSKKGLIVNFSLGILAQGDPSLDVEFSGKDAGSAAANQYLTEFSKNAAQRLKDSNSYDNLRNYPHFSLGIEYKF